VCANGTALDEALAETGSKKKDYSGVVVSTITVFFQVHSAWPSFVGRCVEYWRWVWTLPGKKRQVIKSSRPCYQDYRLIAC